MTRSQKINKLGNAIVAYRGGYNAATGEWKYRPQASKRESCALWLARLKLGVQTSMKAIDGFKTREEFDRWIRSL